jgi:NAD(P)-dependent dehydrogenase (short-subunit alcohol dehydrogenase family)
MRWSDKVVLITGGAIGFGRSFASAFAAEGAAIVIADIDAEAGEFAAKALVADGYDALAVHCDVAREDMVDAAVAAAVARFGGVDILINNAGKHLSKYNQPFGVLPRDEVRALFDVNVIGVVNCSIACRDSMRGRGGGAIVNLSSISGFLPTSPYGVSKLAVRGLTIALATELGADGIRVNAVAPGLTATENALADLPEEMVATFKDELQLVKRTGTMGDVTPVVLFLCSDDAAFITGETLKVSGGYPLGI